MLFLFAILLVISIFIFQRGHDKHLSRWCAAIPLFFGSGCLGTSFYDWAFVFNRSFFIFFRSCASICFMLSQQFAPYIFLVYAFVQSGLFYNIKTEQKAKILLCIPPIFMLFLFPILPYYKPSFFVLSIWVTPYILIANFLLSYNCYKETNKQVKLQKFLNCLILIPTTSFWLVTSNLIRIVHLEGYWRDNTILIAFAVIIFLIASLKCGIMGIRIRLEQNSFDQSFKMISKGTLPIIHTLKNELVKIDLSIDNINEELLSESFEKSFVTRQLQYMCKSTEFLKQYVNQIKTYIKDDSLHEKAVDLRLLIEQSLARAKPILLKKQAQYINRCPEDLSIVCDALRISDVLDNLLSNAADALMTEGKIIVETQRLRRHMCVTIQDNGVGISNANLEHVLEPFYTTKRNASHFGIGLSYCMDVMQRHQGKLTVKSALGVGTTVSLYFPASKIDTQNRSDKKEVSHE